MTELTNKVSEVSELKPCPFCGHDKIEMDNTGPIIGKYYAECMNINCVAEGPTANTAAEAAKKWNKRTNG